MVLIRQQRLDVLRERWRAVVAAEFVRVEIAVRALAYAPGQVDVERQGRRCEHVDHCRSGFSRELLLRRTHASCAGGPDWLGRWAWGSARTVCTPSRPPLSVAGGGGQTPGCRRARQSVRLGK